VLSSVSRSIISSSAQHGSSVSQSQGEGSGTAERQMQPCGSFTACSVASCHHPFSGPACTVGLQCRSLCITDCQLQLYPLFAVAVPSAWLWVLDQRSKYCILQYCNSQRCGAWGRSCGVSCPAVLSLVLLVQALRLAATMCSQNTTQPTTPLHSQLNSLHSEKLQSHRWSHPDREKKFWTQTVW
jgi:hypothetical protein